ncbi:hypothetical protein [Streptomyces sp. NPDC002952]|uniref:hypothetical protein n=1 Tax=Streptomyces sp. NPDC002952 TaxID=3364673 RepID=UPI0036AD2C95
MRDRPCPAVRIAGVVPALVAVRRQALPARLSVRWFASAMVDAALLAATYVRQPESVVSVYKVWTVLGMTVRHTAVSRMKTVWLLVTVSSAATVPTVAALLG